MKRYKKLGILLAILVVVCAAAFAVSRIQERQEEIKNSGENILEIAPDTVTALSWEQDGETLAFHREDKWLYDEDEAFPVDEEKIGKRLELFAPLGAAFIIENVENYAQYGLDKPVCTIKLTAGETQHEIKLGAFSKLDSQRYVDTGDGNVYLVSTDPMDLFSAELPDMIHNDELLHYDQVTKATFSGKNPYSLSYEKDSKKSFRADDIYFVQIGEETLPLDTASVDSYLKRLGTLDLSEYATYNASKEELKSFGLDAPELTVSVDYTHKDEEGKDVSDTFILHVSRDPKERKAAKPEESKDTDNAEEEKITAYARVGDSQIVYRLAQSDYKALTASTVNHLRHREVIPATLEDVARIDVTLEGETYEFTAGDKDNGRVWLYQGTELEDNALQDALESLKASSAEDFTDEQSMGKEEISFTAHLKLDGEPSIQIQFCRYDGKSCLAVVDGKPTALIPRSSVVSLMEAVNAAVLDTP